MPALTIQNSKGMHQHISHCLDPKQARHRRRNPRTCHLDPPVRIHQQVGLFNTVCTMPRLCKYSMPFVPSSAMFRRRFQPSCVILSGEALAAVSTL